MTSTTNFFTFKKIIIIIIIIIAPSSYVINFSNLIFWKYNVVQACRTSWVRIPERFYPHAFSYHDSQTSENCKNLRALTFTLFRIKDKTMDSFCSPSPLHVIIVVIRIFNIILSLGGNFTSLYAHFVPVCACVRVWM